MSILVLNQGLKNTRCIAFDLVGNVLAESSYELETTVSGSFIEQDPKLWKDLAYKVISDVTYKLGNKANSIKYLTVTTSASCLLPVDKNGRPLRNCILVSDTRSQKEVEHINNLNEFKSVSSQTKMGCSPDLMAPKILWLNNNEKKIVDQTAYFLNAGDYLNSIFSGNFVTDANNALKFYYLLDEECYPAALYEKIGIKVDQLPKVQKTGSSIGPVTKEASDITGLPRSCNVILSTYDAIASIAGAGNFNEGEAVDVSGTVTSFRVVSDQFKHDASHRVYVVPYLDENKWLIGGSNNLGGGVIEWLKDFAYSSLKDPYQQIEFDALSQDPCPNGAVFLPHLLGQRTPLWNPDCRGVFFGMNRSHTKEQFTRSVLEGVAFSIRDIGEVIKSLDIDISSITVSGGLARLDVVSQIKSDVFGVPVTKLMNFETTAIGAALISLIGQQEFSSIQDAFNVFVKVDKVFEPNQINHEIYNDFYELYSEVYKSLTGAYIARSKLIEKTRKKAIDKDFFRGNL